ncbi:MAG: hypothetical protein J6M06_01090 [Synergistaceae bacterium]|nr:hypothetical protein [Synergistaceae bacterium]
MDRFFFTYGQDERQPFIGGWTEIEAPDMDAAIAVFRVYHPDRDDAGFVNCAGIYPEAEFIKTRISREGSNFGVACREVIKLSHRLVI